MDHVNAKLAGQARRNLNPKYYCLTIRVSFDEWKMMRALAAEASQRAGRWITTHQYHQGVIRDHLEREAARLCWEAERQAELDKRPKPR